MAWDLFPTVSKGWVLVPVENLSNQQVLALLTLDLPAGISVDVTTEVSGTSMQVARLTDRTWQVMLPASSGILPTVTNLYLIAGLDAGSPPGFYAIQGSLEPLHL